MKNIVYLSVLSSILWSVTCFAQVFSGAEEVGPEQIMNNLSIEDQGLDNLNDEVVLDERNEPVVEFSTEFLRSKGIYLLDRTLSDGSDNSNSNASGGFYGDALPAAEAKEILEENLFQANINSINKRTDKLTKIQLKPYETVEINGLLITAKNCVSNYGDVKGNDILFISITDSDENMLFNGWLYAQAPSASSFSHPVYSLKLQNCVVNKEF